MKHAIVDYETLSELDLELVGAYEYCQHKSTQILCVGWAVADSISGLLTAPTRSWSSGIPSPYGDFKHVLFDPNTLLYAHNAAFDRLVTQFVLPRLIKDPRIAEIPISRWRCSMALCYSYALPGNLEKAAQVLRLPIQKDMEGNRLMKKYMKPRRPTKADSRKWHCKLADLKRIMQYCETDVRATAHVLNALDPLIPSEQALWESNQRMNSRGFYVDRPLVTKALALIEGEIPKLHRETLELTDGAVGRTTQNVKLLEFLRYRRVHLPNLQADTVADALNQPRLDGIARRLLEIRQAVGKTSTAKFEAFDQRSRTDSRVRDHQGYHVASTGRDGGRGVQPQNFPARGWSWDAGEAVEDVRDFGPEMLRALYGNIMPVLSSILRGCVMATPGRLLYCGDFAAIELRVLFWVANHKLGLEWIRDGRKLYEELAALIYGVPITKDDPRRQVGKAAVLGAGFGMGWSRFLETCRDNGMELDEDTARRAIETYREVNHPVPRLWKNLERAAIEAVTHPGKAYRINHTRWYKKGRFLFCELPCGRRLSYCDPAVVKVTKFGREQTCLRFWGVNPKTRQWAIEDTWGGKLTENVVQAIARDLLKYSEGRTTDAGYHTVITAHDEVLAERKVGDLDDFKSLMEERPPWGLDIPITVEAWSDFRYRK